MIFILKILIRKILYPLLTKYDYVSSLICYLFLPYSHKKFSGRLNLLIDSDQINCFKKICIFATFTNKLSISTKLYIKALKNINYGVIVVNNNFDLSEDLEFLKLNTLMTFNRKNIGRDIGAFKDVFLYLLSKKYLSNLDCLCFANDSVQFIPGKNQRYFQDSILKFEKSTSQALFSHFSNEGKPHFQSYFSIVKRKIFCSVKYKSYWKNYMPLSNREHAVHKGEILISQLIYNKIPKPTILYTPSNLEHSLEHLNKSKNRYLLNIRISELIPSLSKTLKIIKIVEFLPLIFQPKINKELLLFISENIKENPFLVNLHKYDYQKYIFELIKNNNPSHVAAFLYPIFISCPFLKNNITLEGSFKIDQAIKLYKLCLKNSMDLNKSKEKKLFKKLVKEYSQNLKDKGSPYAKEKKFIKGILVGINGGFKYSLN